MANKARKLATGLAFTVTLFTAIQTVAAEDRHVTLVLHVEDYDRILAADRSLAEAEVTRIYATAGVHTVWANGNEHADTPGAAFARDSFLPRIMRANVGVCSNNNRDFTTEQGVVIRGILLAPSRPYAAEIPYGTVNGSFRR